MATKIAGLVAYPSSPEDISMTIVRAIEKLHKQESFGYELKTWEENDIPGRFINSEILARIKEGNILIADITRLNFNVVFEIGYAIGQGKRLFLIQNSAYRQINDFVREVGIFDTLGYKKYSDSNMLASYISAIQDLTPIEFHSVPLSQNTPVYLLLPPIQTDVETHLVSRIKKARLFYRSFDPKEQGRLSAIDAIENVAASQGVIIPLVRNDYVDSEIHNLRAAFVAGLTIGMEKIPLLLQSGEDPVPLDYRDLVSSFRFPEQMDQYIGDFATEITARIQISKPPLATKPISFLESLNIGASSAENEYRDLGQYYIETDEFNSVKRGEVQVVLGRKGSGKTALFFQLRDRLRENKHVVVLDLKPEGFQLLKFKEQILDFLEEGTREHTITAFWEYLLLLEICQKLLQEDKTNVFRDHKLFEPYQRLSAIYSSDQFIAEGDFSERMAKLTQRIVEDFSKHKDAEESVKRLSTSQITELIYKHDLATLRDNLVMYMQHKEGLWILFDNLDKGWPSYGVGPEDVLSLRCLLDAMAKLEKAFRRRDIDARGIIFIRNDVFENLVEATSDRGKISHVLVDWTDPNLLLEVLRRRFLSSGIRSDIHFEDIWHQVCASHISGEDSAYYIVDRCLMRPRSLIEFLRFCRSHAVNLGHTKIEIEDILHGEERYSTQLVNDISYEISDILPKAGNVLYELIECPPELNQELLDRIITKITNDETLKSRIIEILLWYGVLGFKRADGDNTFIYTMRYDMKRLRALLAKHASENFSYVINPAFWKGLEIHTSLNQ